MTNTALLKAKIESLGLKYTYIAKCLGLSDHGLAKKINNLTEFKATEIQNLCEVLRISELEEKEQIFFATM